MIDRIFKVKPSCTDQGLVSRGRVDFKVLARLNGRNVVEMEVRFDDSIDDWTW